MLPVLTGTGGAQAGENWAYLADSKLELAEAGTTQIFPTAPILTRNLLKRPNQMKPALPCCWAPSGRVPCIVSHSSLEENLVGHTHTCEGLAVAIAWIGTPGVLAFLGNKSTSSCHKHRKWTRQEMG